MWRHEAHTGWYDWWVTTGTADWGTRAFMEFLTPRDLTLLLAVVARVWRGDDTSLFYYLAKRPWPNIKKDLEHRLLYCDTMIEFDPFDADDLYVEWRVSLSALDREAYTESEKDMTVVIKEFVAEWRRSLSPPATLYWMIHGRPHYVVEELYYSWITLNVAIPDIRDDDED